MEEQELSGLVKNIISIKSQFYHAFGKPFPINSDITPGAFYLLMYLKNKELQTMSNLGKLLMISKPNVTALVNKLISKGLVVRTADKTDRRIINIRLSSKGIHFVETNSKKYLDVVKNKLSDLKDDELELFAASFQNIRNILLKINETESDKK